MKIEYLIIGVIGGVLGAALETYFGPIVVLFFAIMLVCILVEGYVDILKH